MLSLTGELAHPEEFLDLGETALVFGKFRAHDGGAVAAFAIGGQCQIERPVLCETRVKCDVEQAALATFSDLGHPLQRLRHLAVAHDPQPAGTFTDDQPSIG
ncbi:hypothetical protein D9M70_533290 [compost metagenome]